MEPAAPHPRRAAGVLVVSDRASDGSRPDEVGPRLRDRLQEADFDVARFSVVPDEMEQIKAAVQAWALGDRLDLIVTTGGTGLGPRDVTPEAILEVADRTVDGLAELMRHEGFAKTRLAALSRQVAAQVGNTLVLALPGSPKGALDSLEAVLPVLDHAMEMLAGAGDRHPQAPPEVTRSSPAVVAGTSASPLDTASLLATLRTDGCGGVVFFEGVVRSPSEGKEVEYLCYEAYEPAASRILRQIAEDAAARHSLAASLAVHRTGKLYPGEVIVVTAAAAAHREAAFEGAREIIERVKAEAPIWKKEVFADGERWVGADQLFEIE